MPSLECQKRASRAFYARNTLKHNTLCNEYYLKNCEELKRKRRDRYSRNKAEIRLKIEAEIRNLMQIHIEHSD